MRVLIAGCGYVGLPLGAELARNGHQVFGLRRSAGAVAEMKAAGIEPIIADLTQPATLAPWPANYDWVVHCAAAGGGGVDQYRAVYLDGVKHLAAWLLPMPLKFVYTSSTGVYSQSDGSIVDETSPTNPGPIPGVFWWKPNAGCWPRRAGALVRRGPAPGGDLWSGPRLLAAPIPER